MLCLLNIVPSVHIISGDLTMLKRTLEPVKTVVYGLRRYDLDRAAALIEAGSQPPGYKAQGYMSHKANIYLVGFQMICTLYTH